MSFLISEEEWQAAKARTDAWAGALTLPNGWLEVRLHVSVSRAKYIPSYEDLAGVKGAFVGDDRQALQLFPRRADHVNIHPYCLHLWACLEPDGDGLPAFGAEGTI